MGRPNRLPNAFVLTLALSAGACGNGSSADSTGEPGSGGTAGNGGAFPAGGAAASGSGGRAGGAHSGDGGASGSSGVAGAPGAGAAGGAGGFGGAAGMSGGGGAGGSASAGPVYYVGPDGDGDDADSNPGTSIASPLATLAEAESRLSDDIHGIVLLAGTHSTSTVVFNAGVFSHVRARAGATPDQVVLDFQGADETLMISEAAGTRLEGITIKNSAGACLTVQNVNGGTALAATDIVVRECSTALTMSAEAAVTLDGVVIEDNTSATGTAGVLKTAGGSMTVRDSRFSRNQNTGGDNGAALHGSDIVVERTRFENNVTDGRGGAAYFDDATIRDSVFVGNEAKDGGALWTVGNVWLERCLFEANVALEQAGAIRANTGTVTAVSSTFAANSGTTGGAAFSGGGFAKFRFAFSTIKDSVAGTDADPGLPAVGRHTGYEFWYSVLDNPAMDDCSGSLSVSAATDTVSSDSSCSKLPESARNISVDLGPLSDNGGPSKTYLPGSGSPLIDAVTLVDDSCPVPGFVVEADPYNDTDQRGVARPIGSACDIGATEQ